MTQTLDIRDEIVQTREKRKEKRDYRKETRERNLDTTYRLGTRDE